MQAPRRLLLPFTHSIDSEALHIALVLVASYNTTLVPLAIMQPSSRSQPFQVRPGQVEQANDFHMLLQHKARHYGVPLEPLTISAIDCSQAIGRKVQDLHCEGILLFIRDEHGVLLEGQNIQQLLNQRPSSIFLVQLPLKRRTKNSKLRKGEPSITRLDMQSEMTTYREGEPSLTEV